LPRVFSMPLLFSLLAWAGPAMAQNPASQSGASLQAEITFWESVRDTRDPAELQAYLDKYPQGTYSGLAKARLERLKQGSAAAQPAASTAKAAEPPPAPAVDPTPKVGDTWTYRYTDLWKPRSAQPDITHTAKAVSENAVLDVVEAGNTRDEFTFAPAPTFATRLGRVLEFSPYLFTFDRYPLGQSFSVSFNPPDASPPWAFRGTTLPAERVVVPAGSFLATRIELNGVRSEQVLPIATRMKVTAWYSREARRVVKYVVESRGRSGPVDRDVFELLSYSLN